MLPLLAQAASAAAEQPVDDVSPLGLFLLALFIGLVGAVFLVELGVAAFLAGAAATLVFAVFLGICASSAVVGLAKGRFGAFFHAFCVQAGAVFGVGVGVAGGVVARLLDAPLGWVKPVGYGAAIGLLAGLLAGHLFAKACRWIAGKCLLKIQADPASPQA